MAAKARTVAEKVKRQQIKEEFDLLTSYFNSMEKELLIGKEEGEPDLKKLAMLYGKSCIVLTHLAAELEIYEKAKV